MADQKISQLTELAEEALADGDFLVVDDVSVPQSKKIKSSSVRNRVQKLTSLFTVGASQSLTPGVVVEFVKDTIIAGTGDNITADVQNTFNTVSTLNAVVVPLTNTAFFIAYADAADSNKGKCVIGTLSAGVFSFGSIVTFETGSITTSPHSAVALSSSSVAIAYTDGGDSNRGKCIVCTISGTTPTFGSETQFNANTTSFIRMVKMTSTKIFIIFKNSSNAGVAIAATISGTTPTFGATNTFDSTSGSIPFDITRINDSAVFFVYETALYTVPKGSVSFATVSGTTITIQSTELFVYKSNGATIIRCVALANDKVFIAVLDGNESKINAFVVKLEPIEEYTIRMGFSFNIEANSVSANSFLALTRLMDDKIIISYADFTEIAYSKICKISGSTITPLAGFNFEAGALTVGGGLSSARLSGQKIVIVYADSGNSNKGTAATLNLSSYLGICQGIGTDGANIPVALEGVSNIHSSLIPGAFYYSNSSGVLSEDLGFPVGRAISATELLIEHKPPTEGFFNFCGDGVRFKADTHAGYGGTDTKIPYFTNVRDNALAAYATITNNNANGCRIVVNRTGIYNISFTFIGQAAATEAFGVSLNSSQLTTAIGSITISDQLTRGVAQVAQSSSCSWEGYLDKGDTIRPHTAGDTPSPTTTLFTMTLVKRMS